MEKWRVYDFIVDKNDSQQENEWNPNDDISGSIIGETGNGAWLIWYAA